MYVVHVYMCVCVCVCIYICIMHTYTHTHTHTHTCIHTNIQTYIHACIHSTYMHTHTHAYIRANNQATEGSMKYADMVASRKNSQARILKSLFTCSVSVIFSECLSCSQKYAYIFSVCHIQCLCVCIINSTH